MLGVTIKQVRKQQGALARYSYLFKQRFMFLDDSERQKGLRLKSSFKLEIISIRALHIGYSCCVMCFVCLFGYKLTLLTVCFLLLLRSASFVLLWSKGKHVNGE